MSRPDFSRLPKDLVKQLLGAAVEDATEDLGVVGAFAITEGLKLAMEYLDKLLTPEPPVLVVANTLVLDIEKPAKPAEDPDNE